MQWINLCRILYCDEGKYMYQNNIFKINKRGVVKSLKLFLKSTADSKHTCMMTFSCLYC